MSSNDNNKRIISVKAERTNCITGEKKYVIVEFYEHYAKELNSWYIQIGRGGVTGYESMRSEHVKEMLEGGWSACAGTKGRWDTLFIPPESMKRIHDWIEHGEEA